MANKCYVMLCYVMLCYVMLCYVMLCYVMLCYVMLCYVMLCYVMLCYVMLCYVMLCYVMLCYVMLCYVMLCYVMLCYVMLCYVMLCYVMLCYVILCYVMLCYVKIYFISSVKYMCSWVEPITSFLSFEPQPDPQCVVGNLEQPVADVPPGHPGMDGVDGMKLLHLRDKLVHNKYQNSACEITTRQTRFNKKFVYSLLMENNAIYRYSAVWILKRHNQAKIIKNR